MSSAPKPVPALAQELIDSIVQHIHDPTTLQRCSLVSASFRDPAQRNLFKEIIITNKNPVLSSLSQSLARNARIARSVRYLSFTYMREHGVLGTALESWEAHLPTVLSFTVNLARLLLSSDFAFIPLMLRPRLLQRLGAAMVKLPLEHISLTKLSFGSSTDLRNLLGGSPHIRYATLFACQVGVDTQSDLTDTSPLGITTLELMYPEASLVHCVKRVVNLSSLCALVTHPQFLDPLLPFMTRLQQLTLRIYATPPQRIDMTGLSQLRQLTVHIGARDLFMQRYVFERVIALPPSALRDLELIFPFNLPHYPPPPREFPDLMRDAGLDGLLVSPSYSSVSLKRLSVVLRSSDEFDEQILAAANELPAVLPFMHRKGLLEVVYEFGADGERRIICERAR